VTDRRLAVDWPLAVVVAIDRANFGDATQIAASVVASHSPETLQTDDQLFTVTLSLLRPRLGATTADAWKQVDRYSGHTTANSIMSEVARHVYVERAVRDRAWLEQTGGAPVQPLHSPNTQLVANALGALQACVQQTAGPRSLAEEVGTTCDALRLIDFIHRSGVGATASSDDLALRRLIDDCSDPLDALLRGRLYPAAVLPPLAESTLARYIRPLVRSTYRRSPDVPLGQGYPLSVLQWLYPDGAKHPPELDLSDPLLCEWLARTATEEGVSKSVQSCARGLLLTEHERQSHSFYADQLSSLASDWSAEDLLALVQKHPDTLQASWTVHALTVEPYSPALRQIADSLLGRSPRMFQGDPEDPLTGSLAKIRSLTNDVLDPTSPQPRDDCTPQLLQEFSSSLHSVAWSPDVMAELEPVLMLALVLVLLRTDPLGPRSLLRVAPAPTTAIDTTVWAVLRSVTTHATPQTVSRLLTQSAPERLVRNETLVWASVMGAPGFPLGQHPKLAPWRNLHDLRTGNGLSVLDVLASTRPNLLDGWSDAELQDELRRRIDLLAPDLSEARFNEIATDCWKFTKPRLKLLRSQERGRSGRAVHMIKKVRH
jgi:hypothetical protein